MKNLKFKNLSLIHLKFKIYNLKLISVLSILLVIGLLLGTAQVSAYLSGKAGAPVTSSGHAMRQPAAVTNGLVGWWKMDEKSGTTIYDSSGNGNNGTATNGPTLNQDGKFARAVSFDGVDDYIAVSQVSSDFNFSNTTFSVSAWIKTSGTSGFITGKNNSDYNSGWQNWLSSGKIGGGIKDNAGGAMVASRYSTSTINDNNWHLATVIYTTNTSNYLLNDITVYVDGGVDQDSLTRSSTNPYAVSSSTLKIGKRDLGTFYTGQIDDVRIYSRALSASEIQQLYAGSKPTNCDQSCVGWWKLDETSGTSITDYSGYGNTGTTSGSPTLNSEGIFNGGIYFDAANDYIQVNDSANLQVQDHTISIWLKKYSADIASNQVLLVKRRGGANLFSYDVEIAAGGDVVRYVLHDGATAKDWVTTTGITDTNWHLLSLTYSGTTMSVYLDGKFKQSTGSGLGAIAYAADNLKIGSWTEGNYRFNGNLDDVRIYNRALTSNEINEIYLSGRP